MSQSPSSECALSLPKALFDIDMELLLRLETGCQLLAKRDTAMRVGHEKLNGQMIHP